MINQPTSEEASVSNQPSLLSQQQEQEQQPPTAASLSLFSYRPGFVTRGIMQ
jgi:hypothetical protein